MLDICTRRAIELRCAAVAILFAAVSNQEKLVTPRLATLDLQNPPAAAASIRMRDRNETTIQNVKRHLIIYA
jgi:glutaredoxin 2